MYAPLQVLDEEHLKVDAQLGGVDQRKIFVLAEKYLPRLGYSKRAHLMNVMLPGFKKAKMSSSDDHSKISLLDSASTIQCKITKAFCEPANVTSNALLSIAKHIIFPSGQQIHCKDSSAAVVTFSNYEKVEEAYTAMKIHPGDLKDALAICLQNLLKPIRAQC